jgi:hypothetical protein
MAIAAGPSLVRSSGRWPRWGGVALAERTELRHRPDPDLGAEHGLGRGRLEQGGFEGAPH